MHLLKFSIVSLSCLNTQMFIYVRSCLIEQQLLIELIFFQPRLNSNEKH